MAPTAKQFAAIGLTALLLRVAVFTAVIVGWKFSVRTYADAGDGISYQVYATAIVGGSSPWTEYDQRVFPGYPILIAATHEITRLSMSAAALAITWLSAALAAMLSAILFQDRRVGWAMVMLIPHWPINSSLAMSEAPMLALTLAGLILSLRGRAIPAGGLLGLAMLVRPVACFALLPALITRWTAGKPRQAISTAAIAALVVLSGFALIKRLTGDALHGVKVYAQSPAAYGGSIFTWPFHSLIQTIWQVHPPAARIVYIGSHVLLVLLACVLLLHWPSKSQPLRLIALLWLAGNTLFTLCIASGPYGWGFYHFPRFMIPATPAFFWAFRSVLPSRAWVWAGLTIVMLGFAVAGVHQALIAGPQPRIFGN